VAVDEHVHDLADLVVLRVIDVLLVPMSDGRKGNPATEVSNAAGFLPLAGAVPPRRRDAF
jgi:hypothetical protein